MSFLSRLFGKAPPPSPVPAPQAPAKADPARAADRAQAAAAEEKALQEAIEARDVRAAARLVVAGSSTRVRQAAAHAIEDPDVLRQLIREVRGGKDNAVYKVLTSKRDRLHAEARKLEQARAGIDAAAEALERHCQRPYDALFGPRLDQAVGRWEEVAAHADPALRESVQQWIARGRETVEEHQRQAEAQAARELAAAHAAAEAERLRQEQAQASAAAAAEEKRLVEEQERALFERHETEQQAFREIGESIRKARGALSGGSTSRAASVRRALEEKLAAAPPLPANLAGQLQHLDQQLAELKDWKSFSVAPKRGELIEEMTALIGATLDPLELADRIKGLQEEWRTLSKGAGENVEADWQRFQEVSQQAYQPCREYFAAQALIREENLRRRDALLAKLTAFESGHDWEQPDWRAVTKVLRETKQEWRRCSPVDRAAGKKQDEGFGAVIATLQARLDAEHTRNVQQKESLIERARQLLASEDARKAIDAIKELQKKWQAVGPVPREADQRLWGEFRQHCDAVFQRRQQELASHTAGLESNKAQAVALCEQVEQITALEGPELRERVRALPEMRKAFEALGEFPRADQRDLLRRFDRGLARCEESMARQRARDAERAWSDLFEAADLVRAYRLAKARSADAPQADVLKQAAEACIAAVQSWPKGGLAALKQGLAHDPSGDPAANETALRMLCIRAELLTDTPTPPEDQPRRREYQLQRLVQGMGQGSRSGETSLDTLAIEWVGAGPVEEAVYEPLLKRFRSCRERGGAGAPKMAS